MDPNYDLCFYFKLITSLFVLISAKTPIPPLKVTHIPIPKITKANHRDVLLRFPTGGITMSEIKCLSMDLKNDEIKLMKELLQTEFVENLNWFVDSVIDAFFLRIADMRMCGNITVTAPETLSILRGNDCSNLFLTEDKHEYFNWNEITNVFLPVNHDSNHWVLVVMHPANKEILGLCNTIYCYFSCILTLFTI